MLEKLYEKSERQTYAALVSLIILQVVMLLALYFKSSPRPPEVIVLFAIGPFLACSLSATIGAIIIGPLSDKTGKALSIAAALMALISFGPQKYFDAQFALIWPAVLTGQIAICVIFYRILRANSSSVDGGQVA